jgi:hypothetical protein
MQHGLLKKLSGNFHIPQQHGFVSLWHCKLRYRVHENGQGKSGQHRATHR